MRLFIAVELPDKVKQLIAAMRSEIPGARWVPTEQLHLTLSFLGDVDDEASKLLIKELGKLKSEQFVLRFVAPGCFPDRRHPRVLWVGLHPEPLLFKLADQVKITVLACGIPQEERPFSPHITLARLKIPASREVALFLDQPVIKMPVVSVDEYILFKSQLTPKGAIHTPVKKFPLG